ncbi:unnamed protein product [Aphanomyces euteiches]
MDGDEVAKIKAFVKKARPTALTLEEKLDILRLHAGLREQGITDVVVKISLWLGRGQETVKAILREYRQTGSLTVAKLPSNKSCHASRVPNTPEVRGIVKQYIRDRSVTRTRTVAKDVLKLLVAKNRVAIKMENTTDYDKENYNACLRAVQAFLKKEGRKREKREGKTSYRMTAALETARNNYLKIMMPIVSEAHRTVVYLDESFIHQHYSRHEKSIYDPSQDEVTRIKHK